jgi:alpha-pyrone synthase
MTKKTHSSAYITALGTAVPQYRFAQSTIGQFMATALDADADAERRLLALYRTTKIQYRHSVLPDYGLSPAEFTFFSPNKDLQPIPTTAQRMARYRQEALPLALAAVEDLNNSQIFDYQKITHIVTVSCTGMYAPGLDIELIKALGLPGQVKRTAVNFMGCYGAFNGMKLAESFCKNDEKSCVLVVCVELCTLHFQNRAEDDFLLSNALFSDGAAAVLVESAPAASGTSLEMIDFFCDLYTEGEQDMAWHIADFGFEMTLSSYIPKLLKKGIKSLVNRLLDQNKIAWKEIQHLAIHPGGRAILEAVEQALDVTPQQNHHAYQVLKLYGNMSSCTVLFVLKSLQESLQSSDNESHIFSCAFGPGLTLESMLLRARIS